MSAITVSQIQLPVVTSENGLHISSRSGCTANAKSLVLVLLQMVKTSYTTAGAQNYQALLGTKHKAQIFCYCGKGNVKCYVNPLPIYPP